MSIQPRRLLEYKIQKKPKKRPPHTLLFTDYVLWARDCISLLPDVKFVDREDLLLAVTPDGKSCCGFWRKNEHKGATFKDLRFTNLVI